MMMYLGSMVVCWQVDQVVFPFFFLEIKLWLPVPFVCRNRKKHKKNDVLALFILIKQTHVLLT